ncbi:MarR family winged helix-turn-helix transcriptional regulator [Microtetraspora sp. NBRC 16547]|uniref:MarR family winged helix-turn-helix transcriptional regulator n=1 Tax=Microtetraspora sp. NBRC 16547 TaxID=3030993 RepID=UPI0024A430B1|nr:MarR family winged helix-turn-helix transcriptional regulator [Microtetraspora sp. NBRC 16547]GLW96691.1 MarR family transcriptional regulator [Microtetraspora sp. NBRC 16547]
MDGPFPLAPSGRAGSGADAPWLDAGEQRAWRAYLRMQGLVAARLNRELQLESGLSLADYEVLVQLTDTPEARLRPFELQDGLQWEQSRLSHHLTRMRRRGLVDREECSEDGRGAFVVLTEKGRQAITAAAPGHVGVVRRFFFDGLTREEVAMLERLSSRILDRLENADAAPEAGPRSNRV